MLTIPIPKVNDEPMWDIWMSIYHAAIVSVADELGIFNCINIQHMHLDEVANHLNIGARPLQILLEPLVALGFLKKSDEKFSLSIIAKEYLLPDSLFYWGAIFEGLRNRNEHKKIIEAIKKGSNQLLFNDKTFTDMWKDGSVTPDAAKNFTSKMHATIFAPSLSAINTNIFKDTNNLLDVGGGSGCFCIAYSKKYPERKSTIFELPTVCCIASEYIKDFGEMSNISLHSGNFFEIDNWPSGHDGILMSQILHDWPIKQCKILLNHAYNMLPSGGNIYIHEMLLENNRSSPLTVACFDLLMFINHKSQQFTVDQLIDLLKSVGFKKPTSTKTFGFYSIVSATK